MTPYKPLHVSSHALREMRKAVPPFTRADVREVYERGERRHAEHQRAGRDVRWAARAVVTRRGKRAEVIYIEHARDVEIVTVYWVGEYD